jgi:PIN domain nuclease of toxin-antitoxin system
MKLLLDTHTFLWFIAGSPHLSAAARALIEDAANEKFASVASLWEMAIDRLLIAQTISESMSVVSADAAFDDCVVTRLY